MTIETFWNVSWNKKRHDLELLIISALSNLSFFNEHNKSTQMISNRCKNKPDFPLFWPAYKNTGDLSYEIHFFSRVDIQLITTFLFETHFQKTSNGHRHIN